MHLWFLYLGVIRAASIRTVPNTMCPTQRFGRHCRPMTAICRRLFLMLKTLRTTFAAISIWRAVNKEFSVCDHHMHRVFAHSISQSSLMRSTGFTGRCDEHASGCSFPQRWILEWIVLRETQIRVPTLDRYSKWHAQSAKKWFVFATSVKYLACGFMRSDPVSGDSLFIVWRQRWKKHSIFFGPAALSLLQILLSLKIVWMVNLSDRLIQAAKPKGTGENKGLRSQGLTCFSRPLRRFA